MIPDPYAWLVWSIASLVPWGVLFAPCPDQRRPMHWASLTTGIDIERLICSRGGDWR